MIQSYRDASARAQGVGAAVFAAAALTLGVVELAGALSNSAMLKSFLPGLVIMKTNTATGLNVIELHVPALRERPEDILPLARILLAEAALRMKRSNGGLTPRAADQLLRYRWPGNVRELENAMERAVALARVNRTDLEDLPEEVRQAMPAPTGQGLVQSLEEVEKDYILAVLERNEGNQTRTAKQLGIGSATLYRKLKSYGVSSPKAPHPTPTT